VLDFGVAHAIFDETGTQPTLGGDVVGTLAYMCPEYAMGNDQGASSCDVYSLGVMAYELICGVRPVVTEGKRLWDAMRAVREHRFASLRERVPGCGADLDLIVDKALRFDPRDRYQSAAAFAADLRHVVTNRPVSARRPTVGYRLAKFLRRVPRAAILAAITIALVSVGGVLSVRQWMLARESVREMALTLDYSSRLPKHRPGVTQPDKTAETLSSVSRRAASELRAHPNVEAGVQYHIGVEYLSTLGRFAEAERMLQRAIRLSGSRGLDDPLVTDVTLRLAALSLWRDNSHVFEDSIWRIVDGLSRRGDEPQKLYYARRQLSWYLSLRGPSDDLTSQLREMDTLAKWLGEPYLQTHAFDAACINAAAMFYSGRAREAEGLLPPLEDIKDGLRRTPWLMAYRNAAHLGAFVQVSLGRIDAAGDLLEQLLHASIAEHGSKSFEAVSIRTRLAGLRWLQGDLAAAERDFADIAESAGPNGLDDSVLRGNAINSRGVCLRDIGRFPEAESVLNEALAIRLRNGGPDSAAVADTRMNLASLYVRWGRGDEALACAQEAARIRQVRGRWTPPLEAECRAMIGRARMLIDGPEAGLEELQRAWRIRIDGGLLTSWQTNMAVEGLLEALLALGRDEEAERVADSEHSKLTELVGPDNSATKLAAQRRANVMQRIAKKPK
jgi:tetratricopeptide (TPR) repeat protein